MNGSATVGLLAFTVVAPVMVICCGGKAALIGIALFGTAGLLTGANLLVISLMATLGAIAFLTARTLRRTRRHNQDLKRDGHSERQAS